MAFNPDILIYEKTVGLDYFDKSTGLLKWSLTDVKDPTLTTSAEGTDATDATGTKVMTFYNAKTAQLTGSNAFLSLNLQAAQYGTEKVTATDTKKIICPKREIIKVGSTEGVKNTTITLEQTPYGEVAGSEIPFIYIRNKNKSIGTAFSVATTASETEFSISGKEITLPTSDEITADTNIIVFYEYESTSAVSIENNADNTPESGVVKMSCIFHDPCDATIKYYGWIVSENAQLSADSAVNFQTDGDHPFTIDFNKDYCSDDGNLFTFIIPEE